ncbi:MAG: hypothetical protein M3Y04_06015 [Actinomycetota bacterium]|nr:hypothetical protein [Actinomycetota bacterium]
MSSQDQPQDQQVDAEEPEDLADEHQPGDAGETKGKDEPDDERIAHITERIDKARGQAEDAGVLIDPDEEHYADSGNTETEDDQTIVPPG